MNPPDALHPPVAPTAISRPWLARLHPGLFGMVLGLLGLSGAWQRLAHMEVGGAAQVSMVLLVLAVGLLVLLLGLWAVKAARFPGVVRQEWSHPVQGALLALLPVSTLMAVALLVPRYPEVAGVAFPVALLALVFQGTMAWHVVAALSTGQTPPELVTPALYLPTVPGGFVGAMALDALGWHGWATLLVGMGLGAWALLEMRKKPAACSNVFSPRRGTFFKALRLAKAPLASRYSTIFFAKMLFKPEIRASNGADAVFTSTPTAFTQSSTTASKPRSSSR